MVASSNFGFLATHDPQLVQLGALAERYFSDDPNTCLIKLRQFGELLAQLTAAKVKLYVSDERQIDLLRRLQDKGVVQGKVYRLFDELGLAGNDATHAVAGDRMTALSNLKYARSLGIWFHRVFTKNPDFHPGPFVPPVDPAVETEALKQELQQLRSELNAQRTTSELAQIAAQQEAQRRQVVQESEVKTQEAVLHVAAIQKSAEEEPAQAIRETNCAVVHDLKDQYIQYPDRIFRAKLIDTKYSNYSELCFASPLLRTSIKSNAKPSAGHQRISMGTITQAPIPLPPLLEQQEIVRRVHSLWKTANQLETNYQEAKAYIDQLDQSILTKAFRGELVPQDPNDEPASVLLERIRAERAKQKASTKTAKKSTAKTGGQRSRKQDAELVQLELPVLE